MFKVEIFGYFMVLKFPSASYNFFFYLCKMSFMTILLLDG